ncbi:hypothetical protein PGTUg99_006619 [Puccinia graminis f. sp. tritici]|uniref:Uncharacterized protein n=1 Tax=Puccinia graminis f. sp. tritici TaxID=56615 RepID=A0A5B0QLB3_PUCGR|nr:hypothetical protein PGTUg99_006619 [Puccinia graminis f. sp. tritici]
MLECSKFELFDARMLTPSLFPWATFDGSHPPYHVHIAERTSNHRTKTRTQAVRSRYHEFSDFE